MLYHRYRPVPGRTPKKILFMCISTKNSEFGVFVLMHSVIVFEENILIRSASGSAGPGYRLAWLSTKCKEMAGLQQIFSKGPPRVFWNDGQKSVKLARVCVLSDFVFWLGSLIKLPASKSKITRALSPNTSKGPPRVFWNDVHIAMIPTRVCGLKVFVFGS